MCRLLKNLHKTVFLTENDVTICLEFYQMSPLKLLLPLWHNMTNNATLFVVLNVFSSRETCVLAPQDNPQTSLSVTTIKQLRCCVFVVTPKLPAWPTKILAKCFYVIFVTWVKLPLIHLVSKCTV